MSVSRSETSGPTIASDEDMDVCFVLADDHAPDATAALRVLMERAPVDWGYRIIPELVGEICEPTRRSFKWERRDGEDVLVRCEPSDPDRDSEWWVFDTIAPGDWEASDA